jgi:hypothetical protein
MRLVGASYTCSRRRCASLGVVLAPFLALGVERFSRERSLRFASLPSNEAAVDERLGCLLFPRGSVCFEAWLLGGKEADGVV